MVSAQELIRIYHHLSDNAIYVWIVGGWGNWAKSNYAAIINGYSDLAVGQFSMILGGQSRSTSSDYQVVTGLEGDVSGLKTDVSALQASNAISFFVADRT